MGLLNLASLVLGLTAWALPLIALIERKDKNKKRMMKQTGFSFIFCILAIWLQLHYQSYLVSIEDWAALADTADAVVVASNVLIAFTLIFNAMVFKRYRRKAMA